MVQTLTFYGAALIFAGMGLSVLLRPQIMPQLFGKDLDAPQWQNEFRAVYGGFGLAIAGGLIYAQSHPEYQAGVALTVALSLLGMALGRIIDRCIHPVSGWPLFFAGAEILLGLIVLSQAV